MTFGHSEPTAEGLGDFRYKMLNGVGRGGARIVVGYQP